MTLNAGNPMNEVVTDATASPMTMIQPSLIVVGVWDRKLTEDDIDLLVGLTNSKRITKLSQKRGKYPADVLAATASIKLKIHQSELVVYRFWNPQLVTACLLPDIRPCLLLNYHSGDAKYLRNIVETWDAFFDVLPALYRTHLRLLDFEETALNTGIISVSAACQSHLTATVSAVKADGEMISRLAENYISSRILGYDH